jgi:hypothetical protein
MTPTPAGQKLIDTFDHIVIINLAHRADRRQEMAAQLARLGLSFDHPSVLRFDACRFDEPAGFPTAGTRGCFHSHLGVWREAAERGDKTVLLLEDDLDFGPDVETLLPAALEALDQQDWSHFYGAVLEWSPSTPPSTPLASAQPNEPVLGGHFIAMHGDAIAKNVAYLDAILTRPAGSPDGGPMHVDGAYGWFRKANPADRTFIARPELGFQRSSRTDIHTLRWPDRFPVLREITALVRRIKRKA